MRTRWPLPALGLPVVMAALAAAGCGSSAPARSGPAPAAPATPTAPTAPGTPTAPSPPTTPGAPTTPAIPTPAGPRLAGRLTVAPAVGRPTGTERFTITLPAMGRPPARSGSASLRTTVELSVGRVTPTGAPAGCLADRLVPVTGGGARHNQIIELGPAQDGSPWCRGTFSARVQELARPSCRPGEMCPQFVRLIGVLGPVRFRIR